MPKCLSCDAPIGDGQDAEVVGDRDGPRYRHTRIEDCRAALTAQDSPSHLKKTRRSGRVPGKLTLEQIERNAK